MKKVFSLTLALLMALSLAACGGGTEPDAPKQPDSGQQSSAPAESQVTADDVNLEEMAAAYDGDIHVTIWGTWAADTPRGGWLEKKAAEFSSKFQNVTIEYVSQGNYAGVNEKLTQGAAAGDLPTLAYVEEAVVPSYNDLAMDLRDYVPSGVISNYQSGLMTSLIAEDGKVMAVPMARSIPMLYVNETYLAQAGKKGEDIKTVDDLMETAKAVYEATGIPGFSLFWDSDCWMFESMIYAYGGQVLSDDGTEVTFGKDYDYVGAKYMEAVKQGLIEGYVTHTYTGARPDDDLKVNFQNGEVAMMLFSNNNFPSYQKTAEENGFEVKLYTQPKGSVVSLTSGGGNWVMCNTATYEEAMIAGGYLAYIASDENVLEWSDLSGGMMFTNSAYNSEAAKAMFDENPNHYAVYEALKHVHKRVNSASWTEMYTYMHDKLAQFTLFPQDTDIHQLVDDMADKCAQIIKDNTW